MAIPIKDTPVISGADAQKFCKELRETFSQPSVRAFNAENERITRNYELMQRISNGAFY
ncbi:MAG: hypothetical protein LBN23_05270 [Paludibacter sp.]|jgi:hypothetical protein|nr:hypothetical protein [Paludibacter sp.]